MCYLQLFWCLYAFLQWFKGIQLYVETLEQLQDFIKFFPNSTPCIIMADFNAALPQKKILPTYWYKLRPYNQNSLLLFDFLVTVLIFLELTRLASTSQPMVLD